LYQDPHEGGVRFVLHYGDMTDATKASVRTRRSQQYRNVLDTVSIVCVAFYGQDTDVRALSKVGQSRQFG
jgi:hypothetical protein